MSRLRQKPARRGRTGDDLRPGDPPKAPGDVPRNSGVDVQRQLVGKTAGFARQTAYAFRKASPAFALAWEDALEQATDELEAEARRRALEGVREPVTNQRGQVVGGWPAALAHPA